MTVSEHMIVDIFRLALWNKNLFAIIIADRFFIT